MSQKLGEKSIVKYFLVPHSPFWTLGIWPVKIQELVGQILRCLLILYISFVNENDDDDLTGLYIIDEAAQHQCSIL